MSSASRVDAPSACARHVIELELRDMRQSPYTEAKPPSSLGLLEYVRILMVPDQRSDWVGYGTVCIPAKPELFAVKRFALLSIDTVMHMGSCR
jgi:hypothetical protein